MSARDRAAALPLLVEPLRPVLRCHRVAGLTLPAFRIYFDMLAAACERGRVVDGERWARASLSADPPVDLDDGHERSAVDVWADVRSELLRAGLAVAVTDAGAELEIVGLAPAPRLLTEGART